MDASFRALVRLLLPQYFAGRIRKRRDGPNIKGAFAAIEIMFFVVLPLFLGEFAEDVLLGSL